jgi:YD repeat-containing protein
MGQVLSQAASVPNMTPPTQFDAHDPVKRRETTTKRTAGSGALCPDAGSLGCQESYILDNLTGVTQGSEPRALAYNSLSRLTDATNPESGHTGYTCDVYGNIPTDSEPWYLAPNYPPNSVERGFR